MREKVREQPPSVIPLRAEVSEMIQNESPYVEDRKLVAHSLIELEITTGKNTVALHDLARELFKNNLLLEQLIKRLEN